jgi:hypothetical protein
MLMRLSGPHFRPTATQKIWQHWESNPGPPGLQPRTSNVTTQILKLVTGDVNYGKRRIMRM